MVATLLPRPWQRRPSVQKDLLGRRPTTQHEKDLSNALSHQHRYHYHFVRHGV